MVPSKLKRHFNSRQPFVSQKDMAYFSRLLEGQSKAATKMVKKVSVADTALEASFRVAELIAKNMKPYTTGEEIIGPACNIIVETMLDKEAQEQISKVPLSNNTISRRISEMSTDINEEVVK
ncbi:zinc finger BED domain-containing protein 5-like [Macrobrachium rosenbergii]|uniref:zinc finger BED domain-containing protein 5-like n=1 Tax=Macrobrachium rosenbergii TaxID=79674 RepID=UPI0034D71D4E